MRRNQGRQQLGGTPAAGRAAIAESNRHPQQHVQALVCDLAEALTAGAVPDAVERPNKILTQVTGALG